MRKAVIKSMIYVGALFGIGNCFVDFNVINSFIATVSALALMFDVTVYSKDIKYRRTLLNMLLEAILLLISYRGSIYLINLACGQIGCLILIVVILTTLFNKIYYTCYK